MITMTIRSSTTARVSRKARSWVGSAEPTTASTARAKAMSVAAGIAQPPRLAVRGEVDHHEDRGRYGDPAGGGDDGDGRVGRTAQRADQQLALELEPGEEEEHAQRPVGGPVLEVEQADLEVLEAPW